MPSGLAGFGAFPFLGALVLFLVALFLFALAGGLELLRLFGFPSFFLLPFLFLGLCGTFRVAQSGLSISHCFLC